MTTKATTAATMISSVAATGRPTVKRSGYPSVVEAAGPGSLTMALLPALATSLLLIFLFVHLSEERTLRPKD